MHTCRKPKPTPNVLQTSPRSKATFWCTRSIAFYLAHGFCESHPPLQAVIKRLASGHGLGDDPLERQLLLLQIIAGSILDLKLGHCIGQGTLNLLLLSTLELHGHGRVGNDFFDAADVGLKLLSGFKFLAESVVGALELLGI